MQRIRNMLLTRAECEQILKNMLNATEELWQLLDYRLERDTTAVGYLGDYYTLTLSYCTADPKNVQTRQLFVKALPQLSDEMEKEAIFRKEAWLYDNLLTYMQEYSNVKWSAKCLYTRPDLIVLENIKLAGYRAAAEKLLSETQLQQLLRSMAAFHASSLVYEQRQNFNIGRECSERLQEITVASNIAWFTTGISAVLAVIKSLPQYQANSWIDQQLAKMVERVYEQVSPSTKYRNVLCHRDLWAGNVFFPADPQDAAILVDYQTCRYSPPAVDLCFCLYLNLTSTERQRLESKSLDFYYNWLQQSLQQFGLQSDEIISKEELLQSYEKFRLFATVYSAVASTIIKVPPAFVTNEFKYIDRSAAIMKHMRENAVFRDEMEKCCIEVVEIAMDNL
ncbi:uncharacterized protein LOC108658713 [Drosophila navojoa]|uniref:uncharacterized protein LOC108658713 n=1 Tax=Drosophila navojoa TaxID=7232 RepID=UPI0011BD74D8|nr:uncharacterized protein LOC108658713 [Drosophila navojoa]XP_030239197.1 uncharacterized protein LOC108658713 [Drosophila navojoa]